MNDDVLGLGIESSCDETCAAVVKNGRTICSNVVASQIPLHRAYHGVVPEIASRAHLENMNAVIDEALKEAGAVFSQLAYVAVTHRPGLVGSLLVGVQAAKVVSYLCRIPLIGINHLEAHLYAPFLEGVEPAYPFIGLLVSGGNTVLSHVRGVGDYEIVGRTVDDAAGEAFDKISKHLGFGYPGGPAIERMAAASRRRPALFPKILTEPGEKRFSYSGIKTAVVQYLLDHPDADLADVAYSFQERVLELLVRRAFNAMRERGVRRLVAAGGVAANGRLRELLEAERREDEIVIIPSPRLCADNAAMVAGLGYHYFVAGRYDSLSLDVKARA